MTFDSLNLSSNLLKNLKKIDFVKLTQVQKEVIPQVIEKKDLLVRSKTGSGKTASYVLPILNDLLATKEKNKKPHIKALILTPTRELTLQVAEFFKTMSLNTNIKVVSLIGGVGISQQLLDVQKGCEIVVATSGRLLDIISKKQISLDKVEYFVLDEADKMLDINFQDELNLVLAQLPNNRQNLLFSATFNEKIYNVASKISSTFTKINIQEEEIIPQTLIQKAILVNKEYKSALLRAFIKEQKLKSVLVFMANKRSCDNIANKFRKYGFSADSFHGDLMQEERIYTLNRFKNRKIEVLFLTDIGARGLDIQDVDCVVNFDLPRSSADYVHRVGRTARAEKDGLALSLLSSEDLEHFRLIEKRYALDIIKEQKEGFLFTKKEIVKQKGTAPVKGKRMSKKDKLRLQQDKDLSK